MLLYSLFLTSLSTNIKITSIFLQLIERLSLTPQFVALGHWAWQFLNIDISQGSVATWLRCGEMFNNDFIANLLMSLPVKELWKSVSIWRSYGQKSSVLVFWFAVYNMDSPCRWASWPTCMRLEVRSRLKPNHGFCDGTTFGTFLFPTKHSFLLSSRTWELCSGIWRWLVN